MADIAQEIKRVLSENPNGIKASAIAKETGWAKSAINSHLYNNPDLYDRDDSYRWRMRNGATVTDPIMAKLQNWDNARICSQEDFDGLADWSHGENHSAYRSARQYVTKKGNRIDCDSNGEYTMLQYLEENNLVLDLGGQALRILYDSAFRENLEYYPDIIALTRDHHIAVIEVKPATAMDYHKNIEKYYALRSYCSQNGFLYMMVDPQMNYMTFEEVRDMDVSTDLYSAFEEWDQTTVDGEVPLLTFNDGHVEEWYELWGNGYSKANFRLQVHSLVLYFEWYNCYKNGFLVYNRPVKVDGNRNVVEYL